MVSLIITLKEGFKEPVGVSHHTPSFTVLSTEGNPFKRVDRFRHSEVCCQLRKGRVQLRLGGGRRRSDRHPRRSRALGPTRLGAEK